MTRRNKIGFSLVVGCVLLAGGVGGVFIYRGVINLIAVRKASDAFMDDLAVGRVDAAYASTAPALKAVTDPRKFRAAYDAYPALRNQGGRVARRWRVYRGDQAEVLYRIPGPPSPVTMSVSLRKDGGVWRVQGFGGR